MATIKLLNENYGHKQHGWLKYGYDAFGNKLKAEKGYRLLKESEKIETGDKVFDIYSGWLSGVEEFEVEHGHHAFFADGRWTTWERKIKTDAQFNEVAIHLKEQNELFNKVIDWINTNDVFWLADLKMFFGVDGEKHRYYHTVTGFIGVLKDENLIQCCDVKGSHRQYITVKKIEHRVPEPCIVTQYREAFGLPLPPQGAKVKIGSLDKQITHYIVWLDCPDDKDVLYAHIQSKHMAENIISHFGWEQDTTRTMTKTKLKTIKDQIPSAL